jgi:hypothetical protein
MVEKLEYLGMCSAYILVNPQIIRTGTRWWHHERGQRTDWDVVPDKRKGGISDVEIMI